MMTKQEQGSVTHDSPLLSNTLLSVESAEPGAIEETE